ncbi:uncharacterized protein LOC129949616 [Eupeodes corollae]|uniref:uncharacterized protein LOC129949616 n=1 Tax=Eupeodes corollae TaxID=290404 RepID=UPI002493B2C2|nr:uncharacterized protein LOC129949616 [Eupeodes corollae]
MLFKQPVIVCVLLTVIHQILSYRFDFVLNVTRALSRTNRFHTFTVFCSDSAYPKNIEGFPLEHELQIYFDVPLVCCNDGLDSRIRLRSNLNINSLGFVVMDEISDEIRNVSELALTKLHEMKIIFIVTGPRASEVTGFELESFFIWCWEFNLLNVIVTFASADGKENQVYTYNPFPNDIHMYNLTNVKVKEYFWNKATNIKGHEFATPVFIDEPLVMKMHNETTNRTQITGSAGRLYKEFIRHINATFFLISVTNNSMHLHQKQVIQLTVDKKIDISIHPAIYLLPYASEGSYPIAHTNACIIMPVVPEIDRSNYIFYAFDINTWRVIFGLFITFLAIELIANYTYERQLLFGRTIATVVAGIIGQASRMTPPPPQTRFLPFGLLVFTGFFVANLYVGILTSLFSTTVYGQQPESAEEIFATGLPILLLDYQVDSYFKTKLFPELLEQNVRITDPDFLAHHLNTLDTNFAYVVKEERWKLISYQQSRLWKPIFKIAQNFCVPNMFLSFPIQLDSPFYEVLKSFTQNVDSAGLYLKWSDMSHYEAKKSGFIDILKETREHPVALTLKHLELAFKLTACGFMACVICFLKRGIIETSLEHINNLKRSSSFSLLEMTANNNISGMSMETFKQILEEKNKELCKELASKADLQLLVDEISSIKVKYEEINNKFQQLESRNKQLELQLDKITLKNTESNLIAHLPNDQNIDMNDRAKFIYAELLGKINDVDTAYSIPSRDLRSETVIGKMRCRESVWAVLRNPTKLKETNIRITKDMPYNMRRRRAKLVATRNAVLVANTQKKIVLRDDRLTWDTVEGLKCGHDNGLSVIGRMFGALPAGLENLMNDLLNQDNVYQMSVKSQAQTSKGVRSGNSTSCQLTKTTAVLGNFDVRSHEYLQAKWKCAVKTNIIKNIDAVHDADADADADANADA